VTSTTHETSCMSSCTHTQDQMPNYQFTSPQLRMAAVTVSSQQQSHHKRSHVMPLACNCCDIQPTVRLFKLCAIWYQTLFVMLAVNKCNLLPRIQLFTFCIHFLHYPLEMSYLTVALMNTHVFWNYNNVLSVADVSGELAASIYTEQLSMMIRISRP